MATFTKFAIAPDGRLVYRATGGAVPSKYKYTVKGNTVYNSKGRKVGQLGKGTKKEQSQIVKTAKKRMKNEDRRLPSGGEFDDEIVNFYDKKNWQSYLDKYKQYGQMTLEGQLKITRREISKQNFASAVDNLVKGGYITPSEGNALWDKYNACKSEKEESDLWKDTIKEFGKKGWKYKSVPKDEKTVG